MAIGAKIAAPQRPVAALVGDGGLLFTVQELATAVELQLSLPIILWNNQGFAEIREGMNARGIPQIGVNGRNPDFMALAAAFGAVGRRPTSQESFIAAVQAALDTPTPTLIEVDQDDDWLV
jgi:5-guanidino-2-oxopentanoate decarboxylase